MFALFAVVILGEATYLAWMATILGDWSPWWFFAGCVATVSAAGFMEPR